MTPGFKPFTVDCLIMTLIFVYFHRVFDKTEFFRQNYDRELFSFKSRLGLTFNDDNTLLTALTHESFKADTVSDDSGDNEASIEISEHNARLSLLG